MFLFIEDVVEVEELEQQLPIVFLFQLWQLTDALLGLFLLMADIVLHALVGDDGAGLDRSRKHHSIERTATAEGDIHLSGGEGEVGIDDGVIEGEALTLVDGNGPRQSQGQLAELALHLGLYLSRLRVQLILCILPFQRFYFYRLAVVRTEHIDATVADFNDFTDAAVEVTMFSRGVIAIALTAIDGVTVAHNTCALTGSMLIRVGVVARIRIWTERGSSIVVRPVVIVHSSSINVKYEGLGKMVSCVLTFSHVVCRMDERTTNRPLTIHRPP